MYKLASLIVVSLALSGCEFGPIERFPRAKGQFAVSDLVTRDFNARFPAQAEINGDSRVLELEISLADISKTECIENIKCHFAKLLKMSLFYDGDVLSDIQQKEYFDQAGQLVKFSVKDSEGIDSVCERVTSDPTRLYAFIGEKGRQPDFKCDNLRATEEYGLNGGNHWSMQAGTDQDRATLVVEEDGQMSSVVSFHLDQYNTVRGIQFSYSDSETNDYIVGSWDR